MTVLELYSKAARVIESCQTLEQCAMADAFRKAASMKILGYRSDLGREYIRALRRQFYAKENQLAEKELLKETAWLGRTGEEAR